MPPTTGVTPAGFVAKTVDDIRQDLVDDLHANCDATLDLDPDQPFGQIATAFSKKAAELWELGATAYSAFDRDSAEDRLLDNIGTLTGSLRLASRKSLVSVTVNLNSGFDQLPGAMTANVVGQTDVQFVNRDEVIATSGAGNYTVFFVAVADGAVVANSGTLTQITIPVTGWNSITNPLDATVGALIEDDPDYRVRQEEELTAEGGSTVDALRAKLLEVDGGKIIQAFVFENTTIFTDVNGLPGKAIECCIYDGLTPTATNADIAQTIWDNKGSGVQTVGTSSANAIDAQGNPQLVYFSRCVVDLVYVELDVSVNASKFPSGGQSLIKAAVALQGNTLDIGQTVVALQLRADALTVAGVSDVPAIRLGYAASPVNTANLITGSRHIAKFDTSRMLVNLV